MGKYLKFLSLALLCLWWPSRPLYAHTSLPPSKSPKHQLEKHLVLNVQHSAALLEEKTDEAEEQREASATHDTFAQILFPAFIPELDTDRKQTTRHYAHPPRFIIFRSIII